MAAEKGGFAYVDFALTPPNSYWLAALTLQECGLLLQGYEVVTTMLVIVGMHRLCFALHLGQCYKIQF